MRLNLDCIRDILIYLDENLKPDRYGNCTPILPCDIAKNILCYKFTENDVYSTIKFLNKEGIIELNKPYINESIGRVSDISFNGFKLLDSIKNPTIWEKIKNKVSNISIENILTLITIANEFK